MASRALSERPGVHSSLVEAARRKGKNVRQLRQDAQSAFAKFDVDGSGCLSDREIKQVIKQLTGKVATSEQVYFLKTELDADGNNIITREEFVLWYIKYVAGEHGQTLNRLLVKDQVGHPRPTTYRLPPPDQAFGVKNPDAAFGAHDAIAYWNAPNVKPQKGRPTGPDLTNRVFGVVNARTDAPVSSIVGNAFGAHPIREPTIPAGTQHARDLAPKHHTPLAESGATISSALRTAAARERIRAQQDQGPGWKLSKFGKRAEGKLERMSVNPAAVHPAYAEMKRRRAELKAATAKGGLKYADTVRSHQGHAEQEGIPQMDFSGVQREE